MTLDVDTKLVVDALKSMKLGGAKGVDAPSVRRKRKTISTDGELPEAHASRIDFVPQLCNEVGACRSRQG